MMLPSAQSIHSTSITSNMQCIQNVVSSSRSKASLILSRIRINPVHVASECTLPVQGSLKRGTRQDIEFELFHLPRMSACPHGIDHSAHQVTPGPPENFSPCRCLSQGMFQVRRVHHIPNLEASPWSPVFDPGYYWYEVENEDVTLVGLRVTT